MCAYMHTFGQAVKSTQISHPRPVCYNTAVLKHIALLAATLSELCQRITAYPLILVYAIGDGFG